jgi:hypothetical protein
MKRRLFILPLVLYSVLMVPLPSSAAAKTIKVGPRSYALVDLNDAIKWIPGSTSEVVQYLLSKCANVRSSGFITTSKPANAGLTLVIPATPGGCLTEVVGGGPGSEDPLDPGRQACFQLVLTNDRANYVLIAATASVTCADLSTQVPGGLAAVTTRAIDGLPKGSSIVIKCQTFFKGAWIDYVARYSDVLPATKQTWFIDDYSVDTAGKDRIDSIPLCQGNYVKVV